MDNNKLQHWGIPGQKHGRRRWQNKDGSLTPAGRVRYAKLAAKRDKLNAKLGETSRDDDDSPRAGGSGVHDDYVKTHSGKHVSAMSTKELQDWSNRRRLEEEYREANMTTGDRFKRWAVKSAKEVGSQVAKEYARKALESGVNMGLSKIGANTNSEGVKSFLKGMGIKWAEKPKYETPKATIMKFDSDDEFRGARKAMGISDKEYAKMQKEYAKAHPEDAAPGYGPGKNSTGSNSQSKSNDKPKDKTKSDKAEAEAAKQQAKADAKAAKQQAKADAKAAKQQAKADAKKTYEPDEIRKKAYSSPEVDLSKFESKSKKDNRVYVDDFEDKSEPTITFTSGGKSTSVSSAKAATIKAMAASGNKTVSEIADKVGVSPSTVQYYLPPPKKKDDKK